MKVTGSITLTIDEFVHVTGDFAFEQGTAETVTLEGPGAVQGSVTFLKIGASNASAFFGVGGPNGPGRMGLAISNVSFALALGTPGAAGLGGMKSFFALRATGSVALVGIDGFSASMQSVTIELNQARPIVSTDAPRAIDFSLRPLTVATGPSSSMALNFAGTLFRASGSIKIEIGGFVYLEGSVAFEKGTTLTAVPLSDGTTVNLTALKIGASNVNAFVGTGYADPLPNDGVFDPGAAAIGLKLSNVSFGIALLKPVAPGATRSYFALKATAGTIALVGVPGFTLAATNLSIEINSSSDSATGQPNPLPTVNFAARNLVLPTGPGGPNVTLDFNGRLLRASGRVTLGIADVQLAADIYFEQTTRTNGQKVIKIAAGDLSFQLGDTFSATTGTASDRATAGIQTANGLLFITPQGVAGKLMLDDISFAVGDTTPDALSGVVAGPGASFTADLELAFNTCCRSRPGRRSGSPPRT
jgi:hypothetical protein